MRYLALATDYDGTLAHDGTVNAATLAALDRVRDSGTVMRLARKLGLPFRGVRDLGGTLDRGVDRPVDDPRAVPQDEARLACAGDGPFAPLRVGDRAKALLEDGEGSAKQHLQHIGPAHPRSS